MTSYSWIGGNGDWNDAANWTPTGVPGASDNATIDASGASVVTIASATDVDDLITGAGATLDVDADLTAITLSNGGALAVAETVQIDDGFVNTGVLQVAATGTVIFNAFQDTNVTTAQLGDFDLAVGATLWFGGGLENAGATLNVAAGEFIEGTIDGGTVDGVVDMGDVKGQNQLFLAGGVTFAGAGGLGSGTINDTGNESGVTFSGTETVSNVTINLGGSLESYGNLGPPELSFGDDVTFAANTTINVVGPMADMGGQGAINNGSLVDSLAGAYLKLEAADFFINNGSIVVSNRASLEITSPSFVNTGLISIGAGSVVSIGASTVPLTTAQLGEFDAAAGATLFLEELDNRGATFHVSAGLQLDGQIDGGVLEGVIQVGFLMGGGFLGFYDSPTFTGIGGSGEGEIDVGGGDNVYFYSGETIGGVNIDVTDGAILGLDGVTISASTTISGSGKTSFYLDDSTIAENLDDAGVFSVSDYARLTIDADDALDLGGTATLAGTIEGPGQLTVSGGTASIVHGARLDVASWSVSDALVYVDEDLTYAGAFELGAGGGLDLNDTFTLAGSADFSGGVMLVGHFRTEGATEITQLGLGQQAIWINSGTATQSGDGLALNDASILSNLSGGVYDIVDDSGVSRDPSHAYINNAGLFEKTGGAGLSTIAVDFDNTGEIDIASGGLDLLGQLWGPGQVHVEAGATLAFGAAAGAAATTSVGVNSAMTFGAGSTLALDGVNVGSTGAVDFAGATIAGDDRLSTFGDVSVAGLTLGGTTIWANYGVATQAGGDLAVGDASGATAIFYNLASGVYDITDDSGVGVGGSTGAPYINNAGLFEKTGGSGVSAIAANIYSKGTISVASGTLDFQAALWGPGTSYAKAGGTVEVDGIVGAGSILAFSGSGGVISLDDLDVSGVKLFHGSISGFAAGDTIDIGAPFGAGTSPLFTENMAGTGGILTLTDGPTTASIALTGVYSSSNFMPMTDGHGGTLLTFHG